MDYTKKTVSELKALCRERKIKGVSGKTKAELIAIVNSIMIPITHVLSTNVIVNNAITSMDHESSTVKTDKLKMIDLFSGTGAFTLAFQHTEKVQCVFANDMIDASKVIYDKNFYGHKLTIANIHDIDSNEIPTHDILTGGFPCFVTGTIVVTDNGCKPIETVELTDKLLTHTGQFRRILNKQCKQNCLKTFLINVMHLPHNIECTEEHPFFVKERTRLWNNETRQYVHSFKEAEWIPASKITQHHYVGVPINTESIIPTRTIMQLTGTSNGFREISVELSLPDQWFMMGYFLGDRWIQNSVKTDDRLCYIIRFAINNKDEEYVVRRISNVLPIICKKQNTEKCKKYEYQNEFWYKILKDFGKHSYGKLIPEWVQSAPKGLIEEFILGYQTANGCINKSNKGIENHHIKYMAVSDSIAFGLQRLYLKLGQLCSLNYSFSLNTRVIEERIVNQNTYSLQIVNRLGNSSSFIEESHAWFKIRDIKPCASKSQQVYNFEVENDNSYCVQNVIVHNCQPFSVAGKREGFNDERSNVFWKILSIIDNHFPKCVILENVKNLVSHDEGKTFQIIRDNLEGRGYYICYKVLNTAKITGIPQHRERVYIVCLKSKKIFDKFNLDFSEIDKIPISSFLEDNVPSKYYYTDKSSVWKLVKDSVVKKNTVYQYRRVYVRENKSSECPTLTANMGSGGHNVPIILDDKGIRKLTPRECFNLQGFPSSYDLPELCDSNLYKLAGNAVSVPVVKLIAERIVLLLLFDC
jgi:DNA (cytosine-5)-methyltransferase 1